MIFSRIYLKWHHNTKLVSSIFILVLLSFGCQRQKTTETVFAKEVLTACESQTLSNRYVVKWEDGSYSVEETLAGTTDEDFRETFVKENLEKIQHIDRDYQIKINNETVVENSFSTINWGPEKIEAPALWSQGVTGAGVYVGVIDGMVDQTHAQLSSNVVSAEQFNSEVNDPTRNKHGSHVAGIIAADPNYGPVKGIAPSAKILSGQFIGNLGGGSLGDAILALNSVANKGAKIINMSWGGAPCVQNLKSALEDLSDRGILLVTASGNEGINLDLSPNYPAAFRLFNQINVAASTIDDWFISFSNRGFRTVNIVAPGVGIYSTVPGNKIESMDGTSMAAPMVAGAAALLWSAHPAANSQQIKQAIYSSVDMNSDYQVSTRGRINVKKALDSLRSILSAQ